MVNYKTPVKGCQGLAENSCGKGEARSFGKGKRQKLAILPGFRQRKSHQVIFSVRIEIRSPKFSSWSVDPA
jgi:hypothetical protein